MIGQQIGSYRVVRKLGEGGMGVVFEGVHEEIERHVAIKILLSGAAANPELAQRFFNEARAVNVIDHPGLVEIFDMGHLHDGAPYIVMELLKGQSLADRIAEAAPRGLLGATALRITRQVASALAAAHARGIVHRDLKPDNVFLVPDPEAAGGERAKVLDFGIAKMAAELAPSGLRTSATVVMGTPAYMAPEQCVSSATVDGKADVYALGVMLYQMLSGRLPFVSEDAGQLLLSHVRDEPPPLSSVAPDVPPNVVAAVEAMLAKDPAARPAMSDVAAKMSELGAVSQVMPKADANAPTMAMPAGGSSGPAHASGSAHLSGRLDEGARLAGSGAVGSAPVVGEDAPKKSRTLFAVAAVAVIVVAGGALGATWYFGLAGRPASPTATIKAAPAPATPPARCGRFADFFVPAPAGFDVMSCRDDAGLATLTFSGYGTAAGACAPLKAWATRLGFAVDSERAGGGADSIVLHRAHERLSLLCASGAAGATAAVSLGALP
jgi:hypothetical protein